MNIFNTENDSKDDDAEMVIHLRKQNLKITDLKGYLF